MSEDWDVLMTILMGFAVGCFLAACVLVYMNGRKR